MIAAAISGTTSARCLLVYLRTQSRLQCTLATNHRNPAIIRKSWVTPSIDAISTAYQPYRCIRSLGKVQGKCAFRRLHCLDFNRLI